MTLPERFAFGQNEVYECPCPMAHLGIDPDVEPNMTVAELFDDYARAMIERGDTTDEKWDGEWCGTLTVEDAKKAWAQAVEEIRYEWKHADEYLQQAVFVENELFN